MFKFIKRLLLFLIIILIGLVIFAFSFINSIEYTVTAGDLPQNVYENSGNLLPYAQTKIVELITADEDERYTLTEEIINLIILDSIRENINENYDPLGDCDTASCLRILDEEYFYIDYVFAELNDDNQLVVTLSSGANKIISKSTALMLTFDIEFDISINMSLTLTLSEYSLGERDLSIKILDFIFNKLDKDSVESSMTMGTLDLNDYTYTLSLLDDVI